MSEFQSTAAPNKTPGTIENLDLVRFEGFSTLNTKPTRQAIKADEMYWCDNFMPVGKDNLKSLPGSSYLSPILQTSGSPAIISFFFFNIVTVQYIIVFFDDGSGQILTFNTAITPATFVAGVVAGTFFTAGPSYFTPACCQYGAQSLLISCPAGLFTFDGTGGIVAVSGSPPGTNIETFQTRVWIAQGANIIFSAPASSTDFSTTDGGGSVTSSDSFLRVAYTKLISSNGYLYVFADSSINYIANVSITSAVPPVTSFKNTNIDPQIGAVWADTVQTFSRNIYFANYYGIHSLTGGTVTKVSSALDALFQNLGIGSGVGPYNRFNPSSAQAVVYGEHIYTALLPIVDPISGLSRNALLMTDGQRWWTGSQETTLTYIGTQEVNSTLIPYGTDGTRVFAILTNYGATLPKTVQSKYWAEPSYVMTKAPYRVAILATGPNPYGLAMTISIDTPQGSNAISTSGVTDPRWTQVGQKLCILNASASGYLTGLTITTSEANVTLQSVTLAQMQYNLEL